MPPHHQPGKSRSRGVTVSRGRADRPAAPARALLLAAAAALSLGIGSAYAASEGGQVANTFFTSLPGVIAQAPVQTAPAVATAQNGQAVRAYATQSSHGTWLFQESHGGDGTEG
jgi:hypothetical protein